MAFEVQDYIPKAKSEYYFLGEWKSGTPTLSGEESRRNSNENSFEPMWIEKSEIEKLNILPGKARDWITDYLENIK